MEFELGDPVRYPGRATIPLASNPGQVVYSHLTTAKRPGTTGASGLVSCNSISVREKLLGIEKRRKPPFCISCKIVLCCFERRKVNTTLRSGHRRRVKSSSNIGRSCWVDIHPSLLSSTHCVNRLLLQPFVCTSNKIVKPCSRLSTVRG